MSVMKELTVRDVMTAKVRTLKASDRASDAYDLMDEHHVRHVPIVDDDNRLEGLVTQRDLLSHVLAVAQDLPLSAKRAILEGVRLETVMTGVPETVEPQDELREAGILLLDHKFGCLPVVEGDRLAGILTEADFVRIVVEASE